MSAQFQYLRLKHQAEAVEAIEQVFADVRFIEPVSVYANPTYSPHEAADTLRGNIERLREQQHIAAGQVSVPRTDTPALQLDVLMETGTGKTFTFIETVHRLQTNGGGEGGEEGETDVADENGADTRQRHPREPEPRLQPFKTEHVGDLDDHAHVGDQPDPPRVDSHLACQVDRIERIVARVGRDHAPQAGAEEGGAGLQEQPRGLDRRQPRPPLRRRRLFHLEIRPGGADARDGERLRPARHPRQRDQPG